MDREFARITAALLDSDPTFGLDLNLTRRQRARLRLTTWTRRTRRTIGARIAGCHLDDYGTW